MISAISDSFTVPSGSSIEDLHIVYWDASSTDLLTTVDMLVGTTSFGSNISSQTLTGVTNQFLGTNQFGYNLYAAWYTFAPIHMLPGDDWYWTLQNACTTSGCSVSNPIYWDENSGPAQAYENTVGSIPSEAFTLTGISNGTTPEPSSIMLFGSGILGVAGLLRRRLNR